MPDESTDQETADVPVYEAALVEPVQSPDVAPRRGDGGR